jgi:hypothetical protein
LTRFGDPGTGPATGGASERLGELAFGEGIADLHAEPVRGDRCVIVGVGFSNPVILLRAGVTGRLPIRPPTLSGQVAVVPAVLAVNGRDRSRTPRITACRIFAEVLGRRPAFDRPGCPDEPDQELLCYLER